MRSERLTPKDGKLAKKLFATMTTVFSEVCGSLSDEYVDLLLRKDDFFAIAAYEGDQVIGGLIAHVLPMTRYESPECFIYDVAVRAEYRRMGIGRALMSALHQAVTAKGVKDVFVLVDNHDQHAMEFYEALGGKASPVTLFLFASP